MENEKISNNQTAEEILDEISIDSKPQEGSAAADAGENQEKKPEKTLLQNILEWIATLGAAVLIALCIRNFLFEPVKVDGHSMEETLHDAEIMAVTKLEYLTGTPERFDVVICHYPDRGWTNFVKRIIGLPGDTVAIKDGYLNVTDSTTGETVRYDEEYINDAYRTGQGRNYGPSRVAKQGDVLAFDGLRFLLKDEGDEGQNAYPYAYSSLDLRQDGVEISLRLLHSWGEDYLVQANGKTYVYRLLERRWYQASQIDSVGASVFSYDDNSQRAVTLYLTALEDCPIAQGEYTVTEDHYFVMGDHRNNSNDSRWAGAIPRSMIKGHVRQVVFPFNQWRSVQ